MQTPETDGLGETGQPDSLKDTVPNRTCLRNSGADRWKSHTSNCWESPGRSQNRTQKLGLQHAPLREMYARYRIIAPEIGAEVVNTL